MERWGIIYTPKAGVLRTHRRWEKIRELLNDRGVEYDFVQSEGHGAEQRLALMLAQNGYTTIVVVGGDGALNRVVNAIGEYDEGLLQSIRFGLIPNGYGNDYATFWGLQEGDVETAVDTLVKGRVKRVDLGVLRMKEGKRYFLNCVNVGLASSIFDIKYKTYRFWGMSGLSYLTSAFVLLFQRLDNHIRFRVNHEVIDHRLMTLCVSNCRGYGQTPNAVPYNGMLDVSTTVQPRVTHLFHGLVLLVRGHFLSFRDARHYRTAQAVEIQEIGNAKVSVDGQVLPRPEMPLSVEVKREMVQFIIP